MPHEPASDIVILIVEDFDGDALLLQEKLRVSQIQGYRVERTCSLAQTLDWLHDHTAEVILLDLNIGDSQGLETIEAVTRAADQAAIIVLTGSHSSEIGFRAIEAGAQDFLGKDEINARNLRRIVAYASARRKFQLQQLRRVIEQYQSQAQALSGEAPQPPNSTPTPAPVHLTEADRSELLQQYRDLLTAYLDSLVLKKSTPDLDLREFTARLGRAGAGPRDVLDLHVAALEAAMQDARPERARFLNTDGRLLALEVMGRLLSFYRAAGAAPRPGRDQ